MDRDQSELQQKASADRAIADLTKHLWCSASKSEDQEGLINHSIAVVCEHLGAQAGAIYMPNPSEQAYEARFQALNPQKPSSIARPFPDLPNQAALRFVAQFDGENRTLSLGKSGVIPAGKDYRSEAFATSLVGDEGRLGFMIVAGNHGPYPWSKASMGIHQRAFARSWPTFDPVSVLADGEGADLVY